MNHYHHPTSKKWSCHDAGQKYKHIAEDATVTVDITAAEMAAILAAYDYGIKSIDEPAYKDLNSVIDKLKRQLWV